MPSQVIAWRLTDPGMLTLTIEGIDEPTAHELRRHLDTCVGAVGGKSAIDPVAETLSRPGVRWIEGDAWSRDATVRQKAAELVCTFVGEVIESRRLSDMRADGVKRVAASAASDGCEQCVRRDGKRFRIDAAPRLPRHVGCRCVLLAED